LAEAGVHPDRLGYMNAHATSTAAGATEAMFRVPALRDQVVPPTANLEVLDHLCAHPGLLFVAGEARRAKIDIALSNSFGFGGTNGALVLGRVQDRGGDPGPPAAGPFRCP
jgi:3-oxoacyl-(acyl-carrier-protein) synthase